MFVDAGVFRRCTCYLSDPPQNETERLVLCAIFVDPIVACQCSSDTNHHTVDEDPFIERQFTLRNQPEGVV